MRFLRAEQLYACAAALCFSLGWNVGRMALNLVVQGVRVAQERAARSIRAPSSRQGAAAVLTLYDLTAVKGSLCACRAGNRFDGNREVRVVVTRGQRIFFIGEVDIILLAGLRVLYGGLQSVWIARNKVPALLHGKLKSRIVRYLGFAVAVLRRALLHELYLAERFDVRACLRAC